MDFQLCSQCVTDTSDPNIQFDSNGVCNHCIEAKSELVKYRFTEEQEKNNLAKLAHQLRTGTSGKYHAVIGLSGGVDSSYVTHLAKQMDIRPLIVHFDNGWNSDKSVANIKKIISKCSFDLETLVINWPEFKDLQRSFFKAGVIDIEVLTDHAIMATLFKLRKQYRIPYVLSGANFTTEHGMPLAWLWRKQDATNIKSIQQKFGTKPIKEFPMLNSFRFQMIKLFGTGGNYLEPLNQINYSKSKAIKTLQDEYGWEYYGGKHYESVFTKFYQAYVLPIKFGVDKRRPHLSALIRNGEITRDDALYELKKPNYEPLELQLDMDFVLKKLGFSKSEFEQMMQEKPHSHLDYGSDQWIFDLWMKYRTDSLRKILAFIRRK